ncbi:MAG TPA: hypothetical protein DCW88_02320 [Agrobacterium sp.]|uniref:pyocin knob domain-containing protein n=1 Tax=Agrobacterium pusense TaxID=648995 RepID=UPI000E81E24F|nr:pyocin knob domain-containing protein [Agrobacterium pusense]MDH1271595.1 pyocin knob domain-containing protein [Agrobacterium pusense]HAU74396.1 hypothetical protein [Agrobacterium sp.]
MAGEAYYNTGTATVAANSKTVTGTGTNWLSAVGGLTAIKAGDKFGIHVGRPIIIASVDSNTQLTLEDNWPGPAQTNAAYKIELTNPDVIAVEAMRRLLGSLGSGVLYGLSQLPSTPSRLLGIDENGLAALLATIPNGQLPTRLQAQPAFVTAANALDTISETGWVSVAASSLTTVNGPAGAGAGVCITQIHNAAAFSQWYVSIGVDNAVYFRRRVSGVFSSWAKLATEDFAKNASNMTTGDIPDAVLNPGLKTAGLLSAELLFSGYARLNTVPTGNYSKAQNGDNLVLTATGTDPQFAFGLNAPGNRARYLAFRIKRTAGSFENTVFYSTPSHNFSNSFRKLWTREVSGEWTTVVLDMWDLTTGGTDWKNSTINNVRVDFTEAAGGVIEVAWIGVFRDSPATYPQDTITDTRTGAPMIVGAFGLGGSGIQLTGSDDLNSLPAVTAFYKWNTSGGPANRPVGEAASMINQHFAADAAAQTVFSISNAFIWHRKKVANVWTEWTRIDGDVSGPAVAIDNAPVGFSGTSGKSIKQLTGPVAALHAVTGAANKLAYFTGAAAMATTDLTAFARTVLDDTTGAAMFATMGATFSGNATAGSAKLPSGLELKWGTSVNSLSDFRQLFPIAFANDCFVALPVNTFDYGGATDRFIGASTSNVDKNGFDIRARNITNGGGVAGQGNAPVRWLAVGW